MNSRPWIAATTLLAASLSVAHAEPAQVLHAGEWETRNDNGPVNHICHLADHPFDRAAIDKMMLASKAKCAPADVRVSGAVTSYTIACEVAGGRMTVNGALTATGPDAFTSRVRSHFEGGKVNMPDMDIRQVARRVGPCRPGDTPSPY